MKIELRKVAHYPRLSQETAAFNADLYIDGVKRATVENDGHGGPNMVHPWQVMTELDAYAKTLPPEEMFGRMVSLSGDYLISTVLEEHLLKKDLQKALKKKILFLRDGKIYETKGGFIDETPGLRILNNLPFDEAFKLYVEFAK
jgi:hypothetical protein